MKYIIYFIAITFTGIILDSYGKSINLNEYYLNTIIAFCELGLAYTILFKMKYFD